MLLNIEINMEKAVEMLDGVAALLTSEGLTDAAGAFTVNRILEKTLSGRDVNDAPFALYSDEYARKKGWTVDLYSSGDMLRSLDYTAESSRATISCSSEIAEYHEGGTFKMPQRRFMGLSEKDKTDMLEAIFTEPLLEIAGA